MRIEEMKTLAGSRGAKHPYRVEAQGEVTFFFPTSFWGRCDAPAGHVTMLHVEERPARNAQFVIRVSQKRTGDELRRDHTFHVADGADCWFIRVIFENGGNYSRHEVTNINKNPYEARIARRTENVHLTGGSSSDRLWIQDYGSTVLVVCFPPLKLEPATDNIQLDETAKVPTALVIGPETGQATRTLRVQNAKKRVWGLALRFNPLYEGHDVSG